MTQCAHKTACGGHKIRKMFLETEVRPLTHPLNVRIVRLYMFFMSHYVEVKINYMTWQRKCMLNFLTNISLNWFA